MKSHCTERANHRRHLCAVGAWLALLLPALAATAGTGEIQTLASVRQAVGAYAARLVADPAAEVLVDRLDPRLRLAQCDRPLDLGLSPGARRSGRTTITVRCAGPRPWALVVGATIDRTVQVLELQRPLGRGETIGAGDLKLVDRRESTLPPAYASDPAEAAGYITTRPLHAGHILSAAELRKPRLIRRGDPVTLSWQASSLTVKVTGTAMADAVAGQRVAVRNPVSKRVIEGVATAPGLVVATTSPSRR